MKLPQIKYMLIKQCISIKSPDLIMPYHFYKVKRISKKILMPISYKGIIYKSTKLCVDYTVVSNKGKKCLIKNDFLSFQFFKNLSKYQAYFKLLIELTSFCFPNIQRLVKDFRVYNQTIRIHEDLMTYYDKIEKLRIFKSLKNVTAYIMRDSGRFSKFSKPIKFIRKLLIFSPKQIDISLCDLLPNLKHLSLSININNISPDLKYLVNLSVKSFHINFTSFYQRSKRFIEDSILLFFNLFWNNVNEKKINCPEHLNITFPHQIDYEYFHRKRFYFDFKNFVHLKSLIIKIPDSRYGFISDPFGSNQFKNMMKNSHNIFGYFNERVKLISKFFINTFLITTLEYIDIPYEDELIPHFCYNYYEDINVTRFYNSNPSFFLSLSNTRKLQLLDKYFTKKSFISLNFPLEIQQLIYENKSFVQNCEQLSLRINHTMNHFEILEMIFPFLKCLNQIILKEIEIEFENIIPTVYKDHDYKLFLLSCQNKSEGYFYNTNSSHGGKKLSYLKLTCNNKFNFNMANFHHTFYEVIDNLFKPYTKSLTIIRLENHFLVK